MKFLSSLLYVSCIQFCIRFIQLNDHSSASFNLLASFAMNAVYN